MSKAGLDALKSAISSMKGRGTQGALARRMKTSSASLWILFSATLLAGACGDKSNEHEQACQAGTEACPCKGDGSCDDGLSCFAKLCLDLRGGFAGASSLPGGAGDGSIDEAGAPSSGGEASGGSTAGAGGSSAGSGGSVASTSGSGGAAGGGKGGSSPAGGVAGSSETFPPEPAGCALVSTCPSCCETTGVFALDSLDMDATKRYVTAFDVTASAATAEFDFASAGEVGAIFFRFSTPQNIGALSISGLGTGGTLEIALVRASGKDGCIYPVLGGSLSSTPSTCWGLGAGPYAALPADQIEVRVRSVSSGRAAINVSSVQYGP